MYVQDYMANGMNGSEERVDPALVAGAKAGVNEVFHRARTPDWREFFDSLENLFRYMMEVQPAEPGTSPHDGSLYETLGGYVSVAGRLTPEGLMFTVPPIRQQTVASLFPGMQLYRTGKEVLVPRSELGSFSRLVPLRGPLEETMEVVNR